MKFARVVALTSSIAVALAQSLETLPDCGVRILRYQPREMRINRRANDRTATMCQEYVG